MNDAMKIISVWSPKGGVGKTTLATNTASAYCAEGKRVLVVDLDDQLSSYKLFQKNKVPWDCVKTIPKEKPQHDVIIIDHPPGQKKVPEAATVLVPFAPSKIDYDSFMDSLSLLNGKQFIPIINKVDFRTKGDREFAKVARKQGALVVKLREVFKTAYGLNGTIYEMRHSQYGVRDAKKEMLSILDKVK